MGHHLLQFKMNLIALAWKNMTGRLMSLEWICHLIHTYFTILSLCCSMASENEASASCLSHGPHGEIMRDVVRTFPAHPFFKPQQTGEKMLARILLTVLTARPAVGYCQVCI